MKVFALALLWPAMILSAGESSPWKIDSQPALSPAEIESWDDFAITGASILKTGESMTMFYIGVALSSDERTSAIGIARSSDGVTWIRHDDNPVLGLDLAEGEYVSSVSVAKWRDEFRAVFVLARSFIATAADKDEPPRRVMTARSEDGEIWQRAQVLSGVAFDPPQSIELRPCLYADSGQLHLWWIGSHEGKPALCHSVSPDGVSWSRPNLEPMSEVDSREVLCIRVYPSGDFTLLVYVVDEHHSTPASIVTKIARDAHSWVAKGPPEFPIETRAEDTVPEIVFNAVGARLFYSAPLYGPDRFGNRTLPLDTPTRGAVLRAAFCSKSTYVGK